MCQGRDQAAALTVRERLQTEIQQRMDLLWAQNPIREILRPLCLRSWQIKLTFQRQWYQDFPWLHFIPGVEGALCFYSRKWTSFSLTGQTELPIHEPTAKSHEQQKRLCRHAV